MKVNEIFGPTIQGEGKSAGMQAMFLRTSLCNLACDWCDTPQTWNWKGTKFKHSEKEGAGNKGPGHNRRRADASAGGTARTYRIVKKG